MTHHRVTPLGQAIGQQLVRLNQPILEEAISKGLPDQRCESCAFRLGTVPNGCTQTMAQEEP